MTSASLLSIYLDVGALRLQVLLNVYEPKSGILNVHTFFVYIYAYIYKTSKDIKRLISTKLYISFNVSLIFVVQISLTIGNMFLIYKLCPQ